MLMDEQMPLAKAFGILAICMFGPNLPTEKHRHADRLQVWKNAAKYALNMNSIKVVSEWRDQKALVIYMQGLLTTAWSVSARTCPTVPAFQVLARKPSFLGSEPSWSSKYLRSECI